MWANHGDSNTKFYHLSTIVRRRCNNIKEISNNHRFLRRWQDIQGYFVLGFQQVFKRSNHWFPYNLEGLIQPMISKEENVMLTSTPLAEEIWDTLKAMHDSKAPGLDRFNALFYKKC